MFCFKDPTRFINIILVEFQRDNLWFQDFYNQGHGYVFHVWQFNVGHGCQDQSRVANRCTAFFYSHLDLRQPKAHNFQIIFIDSLSLTHSLSLYYICIIYIFEWAWSVDLWIPYDTWKWRVCDTSFQPHDIWIRVSAQRRATPLSRSYGKLSNLILISIISIIMFMAITIIEKDHTTFSVFSNTFPIHFQSMAIYGHLWSFFWGRLYHATLFETGMATRMLLWDNKAGRRGAEARLVVGWLLWRPAERRPPPLCF